MFVVRFGVRTGVAPWEGFQGGDRRGFHVCGLRTGGRVECWGDDTYGQSSPPAGAFVEVHASAAYTCGLRPAGQIECWGLADAQPCFSYWSDEPRENYYRDPFDVCPGWNRDPVPDATFATFDVLKVHPFNGISSWHSGRICGVTVAGDLLCWNDGRGLPQRPPAGRFVAVDAGADHTCVLDEAGEVACWGRLPGEPQAPAGTPDHMVVVPDAAGGAAGWEVPPGPFAAVSSGWRHSCGMRATGEAVCWGEDRYGETEAPDGEFTAVSAGRWLTCGLRPAGEAECWYLLPWTLLAPGGAFTALSAGRNHACGVRSDATLECWTAEDPPGWGRPAADGQLQRLDIKQPSAVTTPKLPERRGAPAALQWLGARVPAGPLSAMDAGGDTTCGVQPSEGVYCWGSANGRSSQFSIEGQFVSVAVGAERPCVARHRNGHTLVRRCAPLVCASDADGHATCLEAEDLASPDGESEEVGAVPSAPTGSLAALDVGFTYCAAPFAAGFVHACALDRRHRAVCWGDDTHGQTSAPDGRFAQITAGRWHTCGLRPDGEAECWGRGPGGYRDVYAAPPLGAPTAPPQGPYTQITAGRSHTCALRPSGEAECWYSY